MLINGGNSITFNTLGNDTYSSQWVRSYHAAGNISNTLYIPSFVVDTIAPYLDNPNNIGTTNNSTPTFTFNSDEAGTITSSLSFSTSNSTINGPNSITFNTLGNTTYSSQWVKVTDAAGNISNTLYIPSFVVDTIAPYLDNPNNIGTTTDRTPTFTFNSDEAGTITSSLSFSTSNSHDKRSQFNYI